MKSSHYLAIAVKLFAIVLFIFSLRQSTSLVEVFLSDSINGMPVSTLFIAGTVLIPLIVSLLLWFFPLSVSKSILKPEIDLPIEPINSTTILTVFVLAIGLYVFYYAFVDLVYWAVLWNMESHSQYSMAPLSLTEDNKANMVATALELVISIGLILKAKTLASNMLKFAK
ncbi:hypothetical protein SIN8267_02079 [Sinobacterium norvegicum]|uniref:DUF2975 domain-containing protein n=1 Tax=Sinobacterium norvegicum TaxID=1641715 RepID=A0ABN8EHX5_9GAMM|nr:hypothetical protein [Sinobacterium norvegicum]CAH0991964.1 hypothetical protein SIN8267_02079 [Sinobacterium norvegicum]